MNNRNSSNMVYRTKPVKASTLRKGDRPTFAESTDELYRKTMGMIRQIRKEQSKAN